MSKSIKRSFAHIINPVDVGPESDLYIAQPITFESMRRAREIATSDCMVALWSIQYEEDMPAVPDDFHVANSLKQSVADYGEFRVPRKLPLLCDILDGLYENTDAEYLIYTNVDIALMPNFYSTINQIINKGVDAFVINRRTISNIHTNPGQLPLMYAEIGQSHYGYDCFIFRREVYPKYDLGNICIGAGGVGNALVANMICFSKTFHEFNDVHLTFHLGNSEVWRNADYADYGEFNSSELENLCLRLGPKFQRGPLPAVGQPFMREYLRWVATQQTAN